MASAKLRMSGGKGRNNNGPGSQETSSSIWRPRSTRREQRSEAGRAGRRGKDQSLTAHTKSNYSKPPREFSLIEKSLILPFLRQNS